MSSFLQNPEYHPFVAPATTEAANDRAKFAIRARHAKEISTVSRNNKNVMTVLDRKVEKIFKELKEKTYQPERRYLVNLSMKPVWEKQQVIL